MIRVKRIYEQPKPDDEIRILVERLWPRGVRREIARELHETSPYLEQRRSCLGSSGAHLSQPEKPQPETLSGKSLWKLPRREVPTGTT